MSFIKPSFLPHHFLVSKKKQESFAAKMPLRGGIGRGRPEPNVVLIDEVRRLRERMETMETTQRRAPDERTEISS